MSRLAVPYSRVSTDEQTNNYSLDSQERAILVALERDSIPVFNTLREDESGLKLDRPQLNRLRSWIREGIVSIVAIHSPDRLTRDPAHFSILWNEFQKYGASLYIVGEGLVAFTPENDTKAL